VCDRKGEREGGNRAYICMIILTLILSSSLPPLKKVHPSGLDGSA
jgi:hypothetical protein